MSEPLKIVKRIADKLIRDTPFRYRLEVAPCNSVFQNVSSCGLQSVDFGRTFGLGRPGVAYAYTQLHSERGEEIEVEIEHSDACRVWLNGQTVYEKSGARAFRLAYDERSIAMSGRFHASLRAGANTLLIKSATYGREWCVFLQPPSRKGAVLESATRPPEIGLRYAADVDARVAQLTNWLVAGPFEAGERDALGEAHGPERELRFGVLYPGRDGAVTWTIPKIEVLGNVIDPLPWGTNYNWNYHNGGVAWAMARLADVAGDARYRDYAWRFCDFHLEGIPFVRHQVKALHAVRCANHHIVETPLLDFTLAPALPFVERLLQEADFGGRAAYEQFVDGMIRYARSEQVRLPGSGIFTRTTPEVYTTWADDMFMGLPFLVQAARYVSDPGERAALLDDAARQALAFGDEVWDEEAQLYRHARQSGRAPATPFWSRCNGWAIWALTEVLQALPEEHPLRAAVVAQVRRHADSLLRHQNARGFWPNVLGRPDSPDEVSGTAIFVMALARGLRAGWLAGERFREAARKGWEAVASRVEPDGTVHDICMGTMCSEDVEYYVRRPLYDNDTHGLFAVLFAGLASHALG
jgi:rhamnogalacturonyl hydrolase YesR